MRIPSTKGATLLSVTSSTRVWLLLNLALVETRASVVPLLRSKINWLLQLSRSAREVSGNQKILADYGSSADATNDAQVLSIEVLHLQILPEVRFISSSVFTHPLRSSFSTTDVRSFVAHCNSCGDSAQATGSLTPEFESADHSTVKIPIIPALISKGTASLNDVDVCNPFLFRYSFFAIALSSPHVSL